MIYFILLIAFILRLPGITQSLWLDEAAQAIMSSAPLNVIWRVDGDFHPPFFHYILHFWMQVSTTEWWMRLLPIIFALATIYIVYLFGKNIFKSKRLGIIASVLLCSSPFHAWYSQELRSYSLLTFLSILSVYFFLKKRWKIYILINILAFFTNYVYIFVILAEFAWIVSFGNVGNGRDRSLRKINTKYIKSFILSQTPLLVAFIFWWSEFSRQLSSGQGIITAYPEWRNLSSPNFLIAIPITLIKFITGRLDMEWNLIWIIYTGLILLTLTTIFWKLFLKKDLKANFLLVMIWVPLVASWFVSFFVPLNNPSRLIYIIPFLCLAIAYFIEIFKDKHLIYIFIVIGVFGIFMQNYMPKNRREDWRGAVEFINDNTTDKKRVLAVFEFIAPFAPWQWYEKEKIDAVGAVPAKANEKDLNIFLATSLVGKNKVYLFEYFADVTDPNRLVRKYLEDEQFKVVEFYEFNNVGFVYEFRRVVL